HTMSLPPSLLSLHDALPIWVCFGLGVVAASGIAWCGDDAPRLSSGSRRRLRVAARREERRREAARAERLVHGHGSINARSWMGRSEEHTSELQSREKLVCRL